jgi:invasion protein IalB
MTYIRRSPIWPDPRVKPPLGAAEIDWSHPLAADLMTYVPLNESGGGCVDFVTGLVAAPLAEGSGSFRRVVSPYGLSLETLGVFTDPPGLNGASLRFLNYPPAPLIAGTMIARFVARFASTDGLVHQAGSFWLDNVNLHHLLKYSDNNVYAGWFVGGTDYRLTASISWAIGDLVSLAISHDSNLTSRRLTKNGVLVTSSSAGFSTTTLTQLHIGGERRPVDSYSWGGGLLGVSQYRRALRDDELLQLHVEPYAMFRPIVRRRISIPAAAPVGAGVATGTIAWNAADAVGTTYTVSGLSFTPNVVLFFWCGNGSATDANSATDHQRRGFGVACNTGAGTERWCCGTTSRVGNTTMNTSREKRTDAIAVTHDPANTTPTLEALLDFDAWLADGFRVIVDDQGAVNLRISWIAWNCTRVKTGEFAEKATTGTQDITDVGFSPDLVIFGSVGDTAGGNSGPQAHSNLCVGMGTVDATQCGVILGQSEDALGTSNTKSYVKSQECLAMMDLTTQNLNGRAEYTAALPNGFRLNWLEVDGAADRRYFYLAIKGGSYSVQSILTGTAPGETVTATFGFQPAGVFVFGAARGDPAADTLLSDDVVYFGAGTSPTSRVAQAVGDFDNASSGNIQTAISYAEIVVTPSAGGGLNYQVDLDAILSTGARFIVDQASGPSNRLIVLGILSPAGQPYVKRLQTIPFMGHGDHRLVAGVF